MGTKFITQLNLSDSIITADSLNTQKETVKTIVKVEVEDISALKDKVLIFNLIMLILNFIVSKKR